MLTSLADVDLRETGVAGTATQQALDLARLAAACGLDGVVCSAVEAPALRAARGKDFKLVTPGIRPGRQQPRRPGARHHAERTRSPTAPITS